jgi:hypothetical protein
MNVRFLAIGKWGEGEVVVSWAPDSRRRDAAVERIIEHSWQEALARKDLHIFDGPMTRLERFSASGKLELDVCLTSYRIFWGTNLNHPEVPPETRSNAIGLSCALESMDGALVLGKRTASVAYYPNYIHPFAGALEPSATIDVFSEIRRELNEELSIDRREIASIVCLGLIEDASILQPELIFWAKCSLDRAEIERRLDAAEHQRCVWIEPTAQGAEQTVDHELLTPVGIGTILLWGRERFGVLWFDAATRARNLQP